MTINFPAFPLRVLHVFKSSHHQSMGGIENAILQMTSASDSQGVKNTILCIGKEAMQAHETRGPDSARVIACPVSLSYDSLSFSRTMFSRFKGMLREHDLVHYHFPFPQQDLMHLWASPRIPTVLTYHSDIVRQRFFCKLYNPLLKQFFSRVDAIVATSVDYVASSSVLQRFKERVSVIPLGLDEAFYPEADPLTRGQWEARVGRDFFLFIGVMRYYKGLDILLDAARMTTQRFVIAGVGPMETPLREKARRLGLNNVTFTGRISEADKAALLRLCRALVFPSHLRAEAFGLALVEGAMFGRPLISCDIGTGTSFVNRHERTGLVVPPADSRAFAAAVETLGRNPGLAEDYGQNARERYLAYFTAGAQAKQYVALYKRLLEAKIH